MQDAAVRKALLGLLTYQVGMCKQLQNFKEVLKPLRQQTLKRMRREAVASGAPRVADADAAIRKALLGLLTDQVSF